MAQRWTIDINDGGYVFAPTTMFSIRSINQIAKSGKTESVETVIALRGKFVGQAPDTAAFVADKHLELRKKLLEAPAPFPVRIKLDGVDKFVFLPSEGVGTPKVRELTEIPDGASHATHVTYEMSIYHQKTSPDGKGEIPFDFDSSADYYNDLLQRAQWHARAEGLNLTAAKTFVMQFKPSGQGLTPLTERYHESARNNTFEATWEYDRTKDGSIVRVSEEVTIKNSGHPVVVAPRVGNFTPPALHQGRFEPGVIEISFEMEGTKPEALVPPDPHFTQGENFVRDVTKERFNAPAIFDPVRGLFRAKFVEYWLNLIRELPVADHHGHDHAFPDVKIPPLKGGIPLR